MSFQFKNYLHESSVAARILQFTEGGVFSPFSAVSYGNNAPVRGLIAKDFMVRC